MRGLRLIALVLLAAVPPASANGRFPTTYSVTFQPGDARKIIVGATFGLVLSSDDGTTWSWVCENAIGFSGNADLHHAATAQGTLVAGTAQGLSLSRDGGCSWNKAAGDLERAFVSDVQVGADGAIWVATATSQAENDLFVSRDDGRVFEATHLPEKTVWWKSVRVAPSDPGRVYVTGYRVAVRADAGTGTEPLVYRLEDGQWRKLSWPAPYEPQLLAVSPTEPNVVFGHVLEGDESLLRSDDGGDSWRSVLQPPLRLETVVVEADGLHAIAGSSAQNGLVYLSSDGGHTFEPAPQSVKMACAGQRSDGTLFACGANFMPDFFALARSRDGLSWTKTFRFSELAGPLECPAGTGEHDLCAPMWPTLASQFGAVGVGSAIDAGTVGGKSKDGCGCGVSPALLLVLVQPWRGRRSRRRCA